MMRLSSICTYECKQNLISKVCFKDFEYCLLWSIDVIVNSMYFIRILIEPSASNDRVMIFRNYHFIEFSE